MRYDTSVEIAAPAGVVWTVLTDVERWPDWTPSMTRIELLDGGPLRVGSRARIRQPRLPAMVWLVTEIDPGHSFTWSASRGGVSGTAVHTVSGPSEGPVVVRLGIEQSGPLAALVGLFMRRITRRYVRMEAEGLKRRCESAATERH